MVSEPISPGAIFEWDVVNWSRALPLWRAALPDDPGGLRALELGARRGGLSLWLASLGMHVDCTDVGDPRDAAAPLHARHALSGRIEYRALDATALPAQPHYDVVAFKSILGAIADPGDPAPRREALRRMHAALRPGGVLLFAENLAGSSLHRALRRRFVPWARTWCYLEIDELETELGHFADARWRTHGFLGAFGRSESQRRLLGQLDTLLAPLLPPSQRYLVYGVARR